MSDAGGAGRMQVEVVIEDPRGATLRHHLDERTGEWRARPHPRARSPWPANYGFIPGTHNPADGDALDALVLASAPLPTGSRALVRVVGLLLRHDGDHKVLAVVVDDPAYAGVDDLHQVPRADLERIERWFQEWTTHDGWADAAEAAALVERARRAAE